MRPLRPTDPREVAGYALSGRLGQGGQGTVFFGTSPQGEPVAVKLLHAHFGHDHDARRHFHRELAALQRVAPFCTAKVLAADPDADPPYVVSEYVDGPSLQEAVRDRGVMAGADLDRLAVATATALGAVHAAGVVHRDFKPANVLLAADGPRVIDFGIARPLDATAATVSGVVGTPAYMSPEQLAGDPAGPPLDLFAWGCTIAYAANGRPPFGHEPLPAVINRILNAEPDLGLLAGALRATVAACLDKDPARRPTAQQVLLGLMDDHRGGRLFPLLPVSPQPRPGPSGSPATPPGRPGGPLPGAHASPSGPPAAASGPNIPPQGPHVSPPGSHGAQSGPRDVQAGAHVSPSGSHGVPSGPHGARSGSHGAQSGPYGVPAGPYAAGPGREAAPAGPYGRPSGAPGAPSGPPRVPSGPYGAPSEPGGPPATQPGRRRTGVIAGTAGAAFVAVVAVIAVIFTTLRNSPGVTTTPGPSASTGTATSAGGSPSPSARAAGQVARTPRLGLEFWQDGALAPMALDDLDDAVTTVSLKGAPFELRFPTLAKDRALQICAWTDRSVFAIEDGGKVADHRCFRPGTGLADYEYGSGTLFLNDEGHNHLVGTRVARHSATLDKVLFATVFRDDVSKPMAEQKQDVYLAVFTDLDGDGKFRKAGKGEFEYVVLDFPS
ncbi:serine/threonine protein kinase [Nonomuraea muscovyensis]|uniref:Serine/threonine protein kinase n=2 Tax=Nonomuraea muscovyensis TaxID=1124761 RepID=A0A7X0BVU7_9ACTN|nr:serine/threonine protein kinase [Nonomuraea muscovyensis]